MIESNKILKSRNKRNENKMYFENRNDLKMLIKFINSGLDNNSSTYFLALLYMDYIFDNYSIKDIFNLYNPYSFETYVLISLVCLVIASKFNEKDPHVPDLNGFIKVYNKYSKFYYIFSIHDLRNMEVIILKLFKYKLNYYSLYQFITFFFANGILFRNNIENSCIQKRINYSEKKILEKIYVKAREILDLIINDFDKYSELFIESDIHISAIIILSWSIDNILNIKIINEESKFFNFYDIDINYFKYKEIYSKINKIMNVNQKDYKQNFENISLNSYNFNYGNINRNNEKKNLYLLSLSNKSININDILKGRRLISDLKGKDNKEIYFYKSRKTIKYKDNDFERNINKLNSDSENKLVLQKKNDNINKVLKNDMSRNSENNFLFNQYNIESENELNKISPFSIQNTHENNEKEISSYDSKFFNFNDNHLYDEINSKKLNLKKKLNIEYNNLNKSHFYKTMIDNTKDIFYKTNKILDESNNLTINNYENLTNINNSNNTIITNYQDKFNNPETTNNKTNLYNNVKPKKNSYNNLSDNNIIYKLKEDYYNLFKKDENKKKTIIINNNIQINNYIHKEIEKDSNLDNFEHLEKDNNKKYSNINRDYNYYDNKKNSQEKNSVRINFKKSNNSFLKKNIFKNLNLNINTKRNSENNRILNSGQFETYFNYGSDYQNKNINSSGRDYHFINLLRGKN